MAVPFSSDASAAPLRRRIEQARRLADALADALYGIGVALGADIDGEAPPLAGPGCEGPPPRRGRTAKIRTPKPRKPQEWTEACFKKMVEDGVVSLEILDFSKDYRLVSIGGGRARRMPVKEADLLGKIAFGADTSPIGRDSFAPWQDKRTLACGRGCKPHAIDVAVGRLRDRLWNEFYVSPRLIESRGGRLRFRLRRAEQTAAAAPRPTERPRHGTRVLVPAE